MKRAIVFIIGFVMAISFSGCTGNSGKIDLDPKNPINLTLWHYYHGPQQNAFDDMVSDFNRTVGIEKGIIIEALSYGGVSELSNAVLASAKGEVGSNEMPDIFSSYADNAFHLNEMGKIANIDDYFSESQLGKYVQAYLNEGYIGSDGKLKIIPVAKCTEVAMLNKTDFDIFAGAVGGAVGYDDLKSFEGIEITAKVYYDWTDAQTPDIPNDGKAFFGIDSVANYLNVVSRQLGKDLIIVEEGKARINYDRETVKKLFDIYYNNIIKGYFAAIGRFRSDDAKTGDILYMISATTSAAYFPLQVTTSSGETHDVELQTFPMPVVNSGKKVAVQQGAGMCISKSTKTREYAASVFLEWITEAGRNTKFAINSAGYGPVSVTAVSENLLKTEIEKSISESAGASKNKSAENLLAVMNTFSAQTQEYEMYALKPFGFSDESRQILDNLGKYASDCLEKMRGEIEEGLSYEAAVEKYTAQDRFQSWFDEFDSKLNELMK